MTKVAEDRPTAAEVFDVLNMSAAGVDFTGVGSEGFRATFALPSCVSTGDMHKQTFASNDGCTCTLDCVQPDLLLAKAMEIVDATSARSAVPSSSLPQHDFQESEEPEHICFRRTLRWWQRLSRSCHVKISRTAPSYRATMVETMDAVVPTSSTDAECRHLPEIDLLGSMSPAACDWSGSQCILIRCARRLHTPACL